MTAAQLSRGSSVAKPIIRPSHRPPSRPRSKRPLYLALVLGVLAVVLAVGAILLSRGGGLSGTYADASGAGSMEFRGSKVYITTVLGTTYVSTYELDGDRVVIKGAGGAQVFNRHGATLDGGVGMKFVKQGTQAAAAPSHD